MPYPQLTRLPEAFRHVTTGIATLGAAAIVALCVWDVGLAGWSVSTVVALAGAAFLLFAGWQVATRRMISADAVDQSDRFLDWIVNSRLSRAIYYAALGMIVIDYFGGDSSMLRTIMISAAVSFSVIMLAIGYFVLRRSPTN